MVNRIPNGGFGPSRKVCKPSKMKPKSKILKKCLKEANITRQHYGLQDKDKAQKIPHAPLEKPINVRGPWPEKSSFSSSKKTGSRASSLGLNNGVTSLAKNTTKARALPRRNNDSSRSNEYQPSLAKEMKRSKAFSSGLNNGVMAKNTLKSRASPRPNNDSSRSNEDLPSLAKKMKYYEASSLGLNNDVIFVAKSIGESLDCHRLNNGSSRHKKIEKSKSSSSRLNIGAMSLANNIEMPKVSSSQNNGVMSATKNPEKSRPCSSSQKNNVISSTKNAEKSKSSLPSDGLPLGKLANPTYVGSKDDYGSTLRVLNNSRPSMEVVSCYMPKNVAVKDNVLLDNNSQGKEIDARNDGPVVSKFLTNNEGSTSKDETMLDKNKYTRVDPSPLEKTMGSQVRQEDLLKEWEATNFSLALNDSPIIQNGQHIFGNNSSPFSKDLSSHQLVEESPKDRINLDSKNQNTSLEDDDITNDDGLKRKRSVLSLVENPKTHEDDDKEAVSAKKRRNFIDNYEEDDGDHWNLSGVGGGTAGVTTSTTTVKDWCTEVSKSFLSESAKLQYYSLLPIDEPIWSGIFKIGSNEYFSMAAHLSPKSCEKVWEVSRSLKAVVNVTKLSRLDAFPKGSAALKPSHDNIALYFLPQETRPHESMDQLFKELIENDMVLRAVVKEAEMLILPSILLPEQHKTFKSKHYLWGVFRSREDNVAVVEEHRDAGCCVCDEEMEDVSRQHVVEEGKEVAGLNIDCEIQAPEQGERQYIEKEPSPYLPEVNAPSPAEAAACPTSAPTTAAAMSANHVQSNSSLGSPSGEMFAFVAGETPRLKELIQELQRDGALVVAMQGEMIG